MFFVWSLLMSALLTGMFGMALPKELINNRDWLIGVNMVSVFISSLLFVLAGFFFDRLHISRLVEKKGTFLEETTVTICFDVVSVDGKIIDGAVFKSYYMYRYDNAPREGRIDLP
ncbi:hypothetical protein L6270_04150 [Candidatus Parcubacteria bacterium]|nr:hypothetical protein [Patescibacteria group bacterium]MBU4432678.1 hypothetical protein [Patescibacteria group bacterium]MCG2697203.1 hypothetical protein [Candidatus Parcubacteria bacterium]